MIKLLVRSRNRRQKRRDRVSAALALREISDALAAKSQEKLEERIAIARQLRHSSKIDQVICEIRQVAESTLYSLFDLDLDCDTGCDTDHGNVAGSHFFDDDWWDNYLE